MEFRISVDGQEDGRAVTDLYNWAALDPELRSAARLSLVYAEIRPGEMGPDAETFLAVANGVSAGVSALSALAQVVLTWWSTRRSAAAVVAKADGGMSVRLNADRSAFIKGGTGEDTVKVIEALSAAGFLVTEGE